ncbi:energy transducer TonB, partial [Sphingorhabdus sp.]|uniref:energy transducer TonB n=1 Tax=Sphingorhabdus sp. TaxID=1902408 RepID=UPI0035ADA918
DTPPPAAPIVPTAAPPAPAAPPPPPPAVAKRPKPIPRGNTSNWANVNDYPSRALQQERQGTTRFSVTVGPDGRVQSCSITSSSGHADLDDATCKNITRRARFEPALDANGNPTTGTWANAVRWEIPK